MPVQRALRRVTRPPVQTPASCPAPGGRAPGPTARLDGFDVIDQLAATRPKLSAGAVPVGGAREAFVRLFGGMPAPLNLPLNTERLIGMQAETGKSAPAGAVLSSALVLNGALDLAGSLGPQGPLGFRLGPIGDAPQNPWFWWQRMVRAGIWSTAPRDAFEAGGPLNPKTGVFSSWGLDASTWGQGDYNVLGTNSPLGAKGALGPLGPMGAVMSLGNMMLSMSGYLLDRGRHTVVRSVVVGAGGDSYDVFEKLAAKFSQELSDRWLLDTSYLVDTSFAPGESVKSFKSTAPNNEIVSVVVVPDMGVTTSSTWPFWPKRMNFDVEVVTEHGKEIAASRLREKVNLVQFQVRKGEKFEVRVRPQGASYTCEQENVRVVVTGAGAHYSDMMWEDILGSDFLALWKSNDKVALHGVFCALTAESFARFKRTLRSGAPPEDPVQFWKACFAAGMKQYASAGDKLAMCQSAIAAYRKTLVEDPLSGADMMKMWRDTMLNTESAREDAFNLTAAAAAEIPNKWLVWMEQSLAGLAAPR